LRRGNRDEKCAWIFYLAAGSGHDLVSSGSSGFSLLPSSSSSWLLLLRPPVARRAMASSPLAPQALSPSSLLLLLLILDLIHSLARTRRPECGSGRQGKPSSTAHVTDKDNTKALFTGMIAGRKQSL
jgi:hypothetical protein